MENDCSLEHTLPMIRWSIGCKSGTIPDNSAYFQVNDLTSLFLKTTMTFAPSTKPPLSWHIILFMAAIHGFALLAFLPSNFRWSAVAVALIFHTITAGVGVTLGFHRLVAHRSFQVPKWLEYLLVFCGSLACQGGPIEWIGLHRHHHAYSDQDNDHHDSTKGFWWSHMEWMFYHVEAKKQIPRFTKDICDDPVYLFLEHYFILVQVALGFLLVVGHW